MLREEHIDPKDPCAHCPDNGQDHGHCRMSHSTKRSRYQIHDPAEEIRHCGDRQDLKPASDHLAVRCIDPKELRSEHVGPYSQHCRHTCRQDHTVQKYPVHALLLPHTVILTRKAHACLCDCVHRYIQESQDVIRCRVARHRS